MPSAVVYKRVYKLLALTFPRPHDLPSARCTDDTACITAGLPATLGKHVEGGQEQRGGAQVEGKKATLSASLRSLVRSTILGLGRKGIRSMSVSSVALPLAPPPVHGARRCHAHAPAPGRCHVHARDSQRSTTKQLRAQFMRARMSLSLQWVATLTDA